MCVQHDNIQIWHKEINQQLYGRFQLLLSLTLLPTLTTFLCEFFCAITTLTQDSVTRCYWIDLFWKIRMYICIFTECFTAANLYLTCMKNKGKINFEVRGWAYFCIYFCVALLQNKTTSSGKTTLIWGSVTAAQKTTENLFWDILGDFSYNTSNTLCF